VRVAVVRFAKFVQLNVNRLLKIGSQDSCAGCNVIERTFNVRLCSCNTIVNLFDDCVISLRLRVFFFFYLFFRKDRAVERKISIDTATIPPLNLLYIITTFCERLIIMLLLALKGPMTGHENIDV
jgi:hypothetical protein